MVRSPAHSPAFLRLPSVFSLILPPLRSPDKAGPLVFAKIRAVRGRTPERAAKQNMSEIIIIGAPKGNRTPVFAVKGRRPRPLDDGRRNFWRRVTALPPAARTLTAAAGAGKFTAGEAARLVRSREPYRAVSIAPGPWPRSQRSPTFQQDEGGRRAPREAPARWDRRRRGTRCRLFWRHRPPPPAAAHGRCQCWRLR